MQHCRAALASLDFFGSVFYQEKIERPAGEANVYFKISNLVSRTIIVIDRTLIQESFCPIQTSDKKILHNIPKNPYL